MCSTTLCITCGMNIFWWVPCKIQCLWLSCLLHPKEETINKYRLHWEQLPACIHLCQILMANQPIQYNDNPMKMANLNCRTFKKYAKIKRTNVLHEKISFKLTSKANSPEWLCIPHPYINVTTLWTVSGLRTLYIWMNRLSC